MINLWLIIGFFGWLLLLRARYVMDELPRFNKYTLAGYVRGCIFAILLGPLSIAFFLYLLWRFISDNNG